MRLATSTTETLTMDLVMANNNTFEKLYLFFLSQKEITKNYKLHITCNGQDIKMKEEVEYFGLVLEQAMKCFCIVYKIVNKSINILNCIYMTTKGLNWKIKIMIVLAMVQCQYNCAMWFSRISISAKKWLQIVQNKVIRFVLGIPPRTGIVDPHLHACLEVSFHTFK